MVSVTAKQSCLDSDSKLKCLTRNGLSCLLWKSPLGARGRRGLRHPPREASSCGPHRCPASPTWQGREAPSGGPLPSGFAWACLSCRTAGGRGGGRAGIVRGAVQEACVLLDTEWSRVRVQPCRRHSEPTQDRARWGQGAFKHPASPGGIFNGRPCRGHSTSGLSSSMSAPKSGARCGDSHPLPPAAHALLWEVVLLYFQGIFHKSLDPGWGTWLEPS